MSHWKDSGYVDTLADAQAKVGDFEQATKYEQQSLNDPSLAQGEKAARGAFTPSSAAETIPRQTGWQYVKIVIEKTNWGLCSNFCNF
jgi:hypothetical protein